MRNIEIECSVEFDFKNLILYILSPDRKSILFKIDLKEREVFLNQQRVIEANILSEKILSELESQRYIIYPYNDFHSLEDISLIDNSYIPAEVLSNINYIKRIIIYNDNLVCLMNDVGNQCVSISIPYGSYYLFDILLYNLDYIRTPIDNHFYIF